MAQRELTLHPETGALVEVVHSYQGVELDQLKQDVTAREQALEEIRTRKQAKLDEVNAITEEENQAQESLEDSKSAATRGEELVGSTPDGVDPGADGASGEVPAEVEGENF